MPPTLYNTLTRSKEAFAPLDPSNVRLYVCGPTVYDFAHIGNARAVVAFDLLYRVLRHEYAAGARIEVAPYKEDPGDFVLWKPSGPELPGWPSPWGRGRPGWHIECSAMCENTLGETFDIHGGGLDLIFPHHENEIAQSVCAHNGRPFARYWMHNGMLTVGGAKMATSDGNFITVRDILAEAPGEVVRLALLGTHYRAPLDWNEDRLHEARQTLNRFYRVLTMPSAEIEFRDLR